MKCFEYKGKGYQYRDCPNRRKAACVTMPQRHSKKSRGKAQSMSYNKEHWNIVERAYLKKHA